MADNVKLSAGTNDGATMRTLETAGGVELAVSTLAYATTLSPGANVVQDVMVGHGLPVVQDGTWTVTPGETPNTNPWNVSLKQGGNTAVVTGDGALTVTGTVTVGSITSITNPVTVISGTAGNFLCTANQGGSWTVAATQSGTWNVGTVSTVTAVTSITNPVAATQSGTWTVGLSAAQTLANVTTVGTITNPVAVTQSGTWNVGITGTVAATQSGTWNVGTVSTVTAVTTVGTITNPVTVAQSNAANLLATVNIASAQALATVTTVGTVTAVTTVGTITNAVTVAQPTAANLNCTAALAAGTNLVGRISSSDETSTLYNGTTALTPKFVKIVASASGATSVVALVSGKKIRALRLSVVANGAVNVKFQSNSTDITGRWFLTQFASGGGGYCPVGLFETAVVEALNINLSASVSVEGILTYIEV